MKLDLLYFKTNFDIYIVKSEVAIWSLSVISQVILFKCCGETFNYTAIVK